LKQELTLRGRQKTLVRDAVLDAALLLFSESGYQKTTMQAIANAAGIGVATLFRHFNTKASVLADLVQRDLEELFRETHKLLEEPPADPKAGITTFCLLMITLLDKPSKSIQLKPTQRPAMLTGRAETDKVVSYADAEFQRMLTLLIEYYQKTRAISSALDAEEIAKIIFHVYNGYYVELSCGLINTRSQLSEKVRGGLQILFEPWI
jgi:AcrR family transcriptional regulator